MTETIRELRGLAQQVETWRVSRGLSKSALCKRFGQLGSSKTYGRLLDDTDDLSEMDVPGQLENYRAAIEVIAASGQDPEDSKLYPDLEHCREAMASVLMALQETENNRLVLITGNTGAGKTRFLDLLVTDKRTANITYLVEATEAWRESTNELLGAILMDVGVTERKTSSDDDDDRKPREAEHYLPTGPGARLRKLVERLNGRRVILAIDEAHHIGPAGFNILKTLINQTSAVVVLTTIPILNQRIIKRAYAEATQLFSNRLFERIPFTGPTVNGAMEFLKRRGVKFASPVAANTICQKVVADAQNYALWNFVSRVAKKAREAGAPHTETTFAKVLNDVKRRM